MTHVCFATPSLSHSVCLEHYKSVFEAAWLLGQKRIDASFKQRGGDQFIAKVRSKLVTEFLHDLPQATHLFFIDDDIGFEAEAVPRFLDYDRDVVAGIYPKRALPLDFPVELEITRLGEIIQEGPLYKCVGAPTGFMCIKRHVLEEMTRHTGMFKDIEKGGETKWFHHIFQTGPGPDGWWWGEDYVFSRKCADLGFKIWVDPNIKFSHRGSWAFEDSLANHMDHFRERAREKAMKMQEGELSDTVSEPEAA